MFNLKFSQLIIPFYTFVILALIWHYCGGSYVAKVAANFASAVNNTIKGFFI